MKNKKLSVIILAFILAVCMITAIACEPISNQLGGNSSQNNASNGSGSVYGDAQKLEILKTNAKLTQEQIASQIKAEYLLENNGYKDKDEITVLISMEGESLVDLFNRKYNDRFESVADFAKSIEGADCIRQINNEQNAVISKLRQKGLISNVKYQYNTVMNAVAVTIQYGKMDNIQKVNGVKRVMMSETFNRPQAVENNVINDVDIYDTGIFKPGDIGFTGKNTAVAVLDSGFDLAHEVFDMTLDKDSLVLNEQAVYDKIVNNPAAKAPQTTKGLELAKVYINDKIPYVYDYADKDTDVTPYDSEHGTHVAGIIGGKSDKITGVAYDTQLVLLKVFPDHDDGGKTEDILAALEDAVLLEVDAINMSLGSACGFTRSSDNEELNRVYASIGATGISLLTAASNSYSSAFGGAQGNTPLVTNPDSGTVGSPSTYSSALSVASISGQKSKYLVANDRQILFFNESNDVTGKANDFFAQLYERLGKNTDETITLDYVVIPGAGLPVNYRAVGDMTNKIAVVRRGGDTTFEDKARYARNAGAAACIIYNNIDGDILMSMGKTNSLPTISISKDDGTELARTARGKITVSYANQAGPFMSDFSSWGPTPSLELKPEITAHGGDIYSAIPNGGYDKMSGTSMATPNLCGLTVLIREYLKQENPGISLIELNRLTNQMLMSTASIVLNEDGNPYSPRKQGAGLASLKNVVNTQAYLTVDGKDRPKLELKDDPDRTGVYNMKFNVVNLGDTSVQYDLSVVGMTESVSTSDSKHIAERPQLLNGNASYNLVSGGTLSGTTLTVDPNGVATIEVEYVLTDGDKNTIDSLFPYGMYVEGFVKLTEVGQRENKVNLNIPFLAFYGNWAQAPMFDKTYYEVENEKYDSSIEADDKLQADYYATTPYGSYFYNYIIPLGTYLYDIDPMQYDQIAASKDRIAISNVFGAIDGISTVYGGLLRNAKEMRFSITDKVTGETVWSLVDPDATKAYSLGGDPIPYFNYLRLNSRTLGLINNRQYEFKMQGVLDYERDDGLTTNARNSFSFDFYMDDEAPILKEVTYEKEYDRTLKKDRYYMTLTMYDNHYVQSVSPVRFTSSTSYTFLSDNPIPVYSEKGQDSTIRIEITDYLDDLFADRLITSALAFSIDDYALNSNIYVCQLPGTRGDFRFTKDGETDGDDLVILSMYEDEIVDVTRYLSTADETLDIDKDYLKYLVWTSSNERVAQVANGQVKCLNEGRATIIVKDQMEAKQAVLIINVKKRGDNYNPSDNVIGDGEDAIITDLRFSYFDTVFAYSRAAQTSEIGATGDRNFISAKQTIRMYPGEKIKLVPSVTPWYSEDNYEFTFASGNERYATVEQDGTVTALQRGNVTISLSVGGSNQMAVIAIEVKSEFVIENRMLVAYKGLGGDVIIPDDEGILQIGAYAFCLFDTDNNIEVSDEDYDANKIPASNTSVKKVIIPHGVEEIQKYAFYNCTGLEEVVLPDTLKIIREYAFYNDKKLTTIDLSKTKAEVIGRSAFYNTRALEAIDLSRVYAMGESAFEGSGITAANLTSLRNAEKSVFKNAKSLAQVTLNRNTKLSEEMFYGSGLTDVDIYNTYSFIPSMCFANCEELLTVNIHGQIERFETGAFQNCTKLSSFNFVTTDGSDGSVKAIGNQAFRGDKALVEFTLPNNEVSIGSYAFAQCSALTTLNLQANTVLTKQEFVLDKDELSSTENAVVTGLNGYAFDKTNLSKFIIDSDNALYTVSNDSKLLIENGKTVIFAAIANTEYDLTGYEAIGAGAFAGSKIVSIVIPDSITSIGNYAFANCAELTAVTLPNAQGFTVGNYAFAIDGRTVTESKLEKVNNLEKASKIGRYAFMQSAITTAAIGDDVLVGEGAFFRSSIKEVTVGANSSFGLGAFQRCASLETVNMPADGGVYFGQGCFANDTNLRTIDLSKVGEKIGAQCFYNCTSITVVNLQHVKEIGNHAFADCSGIVTLTMPVVEKIGNGAFGRNALGGRAPYIMTLVLPDTLTELGTEAFFYCPSLTEVTLSANLTKISESAFANCERLMTVNGQGFTEVGKYAFANCGRLANISLGQVTKFDDYAFSSCTALKNVDLSSAKTIGFASFSSTGIVGDIVANNLVSVGDYAFQKAIDDYDNAAEGFTSFTAPNLETIGSAAFQHNRDLTEFIFSNKIKQVGAVAFNDCTGITSFYYNSADGKLADGEINGYAKLTDGVLYTRMQSGYYQLSSVPAGKQSTELTVDDGTRRIEVYAGNENTHIERINLPDSLKLIGNYAFYGYRNLRVVEFRSINAPVLENSYNRNLTLEENDPGYGLIHNIFDMFGDELCYCNFVGLVGKNQPIRMILPANKNISGYDSIVYQAYFGKVDSATRSDYESAEQAFVSFIEYAEQLATVNTVTLEQEELVNNALAALGAVTQDATALASRYGYTASQYLLMTNNVRQAREQIIKLRIVNSNKLVKDVQQLLDNLPAGAFNISMLSELNAAYKAINSLSVEDRAVLDLTQYNRLMTAYNNYCQSVQAEVTPIVNNVSGASAATQVAATVFALLALAVVIKKSVKL